MKNIVIFASILYAMSIFALGNADKTTEKPVVDKPTEKQQLNQIYAQHKEQQQALHIKHQQEQQNLHKQQEQEQNQLQKKQQIELQVFQKQQLQIQQNILLQQQQILNQQQQQIKEQELEMQQQELQQQQSEQIGSGSGPGTGAFCKVGKLNVVTYAASCFDNCSTVQVNFAKCPSGKVCCSTVDTVTKIVFDKILY